MPYAYTLYGGAHLAALARASASSLFILSIARLAAGLT